MGSRLASGLNPSGPPVVEGVDYYEEFLFELRPVTQQDVRDKINII